MDFKNRIEEIGINTLAESIRAFRERVESDIGVLNEEKDELKSNLGKRKREENTQDFSNKDGPSRKKQKLEIKSTPVADTKKKSEKNMMDEEEEDTNEEEDYGNYVTPPVNTRYRKGTESKESQTSLELVSPCKTKQIQAAIDFQQANEEFKRMEQRNRPPHPPPPPPPRILSASDLPQRPVMEINRSSPIETYIVKELHENSWKPIRKSEYIITLKFSPEELILGVLTNVRIILCRFVGTDLVIFRTIDYDLSGRSEADKFYFTTDGKFVVICGKLKAFMDEKDIFRKNYSYFCRLFPVFERRGDEVDEDEDDDEESFKKRKKLADDDDEDEDDDTESSSSGSSEPDIFFPRSRRKQRKKKKKKKELSDDDRIVTLNETKGEDRIICALFPDEKYFDEQWKSSRKMIVVTEKEVIQYNLYRENWDYEDHKEYSVKNSEDDEEEEEDDDDDDADTQIEFDKVKKRRMKFVCANILHRERSNSLLMVATNQNKILFWVIQRADLVKSYNIPEEPNMQITKIKSLLLNSEGLFVMVKVDPCDNDAFELPQEAGKNLAGKGENDIDRSLEIIKEDDDDDEGDNNIPTNKKIKTGFRVIYIHDRGERYFTNIYDTNGEYDFTCCDWIRGPIDFSYLIAGTRKLEVLVYKVTGQLMGKLESFGFSEAVLMEEMNIKRKYGGGEEEEEDDDDDDDDEETEDEKRERVGFNSIDRHCKYPLIAFSIRKGISIFVQRESLE